MAIVPPMRSATRVQKRVMAFLLSFLARSATLTRGVAGHAQRSDRNAHGFLRRNVAAVPPPRSGRPFRAGPGLRRPIGVLPKYQPVAENGVIVDAQNANRL